MVCVEDGGDDMSQPDLRNLRAVPVEVLADRLRGLPVEQRRELAGLLWISSRRDEREEAATHYDAHVRAWSKRQPVDLGTAQWAVESNQISVDLSGLYSFNVDPVHDP